MRLKLLPVGCPERMATLAGSQASPDPGSAVDYDERAARSVTVHVLPSITLAQVDKVFRAAGLPVEISFRLGKRAACVVLSSPEFLDAALSLRGAAIQPKSSASLPPCVLEIEPGVVKPPAEKVAQGASNGKKN